MTTTEYVYIKMPRSGWEQLVGDFEDMCGTSREDIEILQEVEEFHFDSFGHACFCQGQVTHG